MRLVRRKTRKAIRKSVSKVIDKHGAQIAAALAGGIASTLATLAGTEVPGKPGKSNLKELSENVGAAVVGQGDHERARSADGHRKGGRERDKARREPRLQAEEGEPEG